MTTKIRHMTVKEQSPMSLLPRIAHNINKGDRLPNTIKNFTNFNPSELLRFDESTASAYSNLGKLNIGVVPDRSLGSNVSRILVKL